MHFIWIFPSLVGYKLTKRGKKRGKIWRNVWIKKGVLGKMYTIQKAQNELWKWFPLLHQLGNGLWMLRCTDFISPCYDNEILLCRKSFSWCLNEIFSTWPIYIPTDFIRYDNLKLRFGTRSLRVAKFSWIYWFYNEAMQSVIHKNTDDGCDGVVHSFV